MSTANRKRINKKMGAARELYGPFNSTMSLSSRKRLDLETELIQKALTAARKAEEFRSQHGAVRDLVKNGEAVSDKGREILEGKR